MSDDVVDVQARAEINRLKKRLNRSTKSTGEPRIPPGAGAGGIVPHPHTGDGQGGLVDAAALTYTPVALADWGSVDPGNVSDALDYLAANLGTGGSASPLTTKGDLWGFDTADARVPVGTDGFVLTADSGDPLGVSWQAVSGSGSVATDTIWDAAGDLAVGTGADTAAKLSLTVPGAANLLNVLGVVNGETSPSWKALFDGTAPADIGTSAAGTGVVAAHRNHVHAAAASAVSVDSTTLVGVGTTVQAVFEEMDDAITLLAGAAHSAVTLNAAADTVLGLSTQQITLDTQSANVIWAGPTSGGAATPTFRALVSADLPSTVVETGDTDWIDLTDGGSTTLHTHAASYTDEQAQDAVGGILTDSSSIDFTYNDGANTITAVVLAAAVDHASLANLTTGDPHTQYALDTDLSNHVSASDPHTGYLLESLFDAKGDLIAASADNTPAKVTVGADDTILMADSSATAGVKWVASASPSAVGTAAATGTADTFTRGDHVHAHEAAHINHDTTWAAAGDLIVGTGNDTAAVVSIGSTGQVLTVVGGTAAWVAAGGGTLDQAYDFGGAGSGRTINATDGAVVITSTDADGAFLLEVTPTPGSAAALGGVRITVGANSTAAALEITQSGSGVAIDIIGSDAIQFRASGGPLISSTTGDKLDLTGGLDVSGNVAFGAGRSISASITAVIGSNETTSATRRVLDINMAYTANANAIAFSGLTVNSSITGTGFTGLQGFGLNFAFTVSGGTWTTVNAVRAVVACSAVVATYRGVLAELPGNPTSGSGSAMAGEFLVPQGANWTERVGIRIGGGAVADELFRFESTAANDDPSWSFHQGAATTTDATVTTLDTVTIPASTTVLIIARVVARRTGGLAGTAEDGAGYTIQATIKNAAGTATIIGAVAATSTQESQAGWDATVDVTGATARLRVTGAVNNNVTWHAHVSVYKVGT